MLFLAGEAAARSTLGDRALRQLVVAVVMIALVPAIGCGAVQAQPVPPHPAMVFYVAKGGPDACGKDCNEWIAAEGPIGIGSAARLRTLLARLGQQRLPVFFESGGGALDEAFQIGRILRERGLTAGVGRTIPQACSTENESACSELKKSGKALAAELKGENARCNSTCVYSFVEKPKSVAECSRWCACDATRQFSSWWA